LGLQAKLVGNLSRDLSRLQSNLRNAAGRVVASEASDIAADARNRAPRRTGRLAQSIRTEVRGTRGRVTADVPYVVPVEYGTSRQAAQPFMRPAALAAERRFPSRARSTLGRVAR
jgi:HK97 gp10 family phage protein